ncbi:hypothetical protein CBQ26_04375 [Deinococcus indicus]|uniref:Uncharacterized protein n=1 Tax=Deinococcus indicus TaxID=223556 RepID=A0A246BPD9_9DEIO|nr:hypothetical protein [Deinococcus indicus]OWL97525.1 hypothetical protein CBQ26_04375 [Deinococcus indicus]GHG29622.1 hypothetical protein GCM10017784_23180 [Deinococcus indicus]
MARLLPGFSAARSVTATLLSLSLGAGSAGATTPPRTPLEPGLVTPGVPQAGPRPLPPTGSLTGSLTDVKPTTGLLTTVSGLRNLIRAGTLRPDAAARAELGEVLLKLRDAQTLGPQLSAQLQAELLATLTPAQGQSLRAHLRAREVQVQGLLARTRIAAPDGPVSPARQALNLLTPGGAAVVSALVQTPDLNPYRAEGVNRELLRTLLALLER